MTSRHCGPTSPRARKNKRGLPAPEYIAASARPFSTVLTRRHAHAVRSSLHERHKLFDTVLTSPNSIAKLFSRLYGELQLAERQHKKIGEARMRRLAWRTVSTLAVFCLLIIAPARAADPEMDKLLRGPVGKDWVTKGGNLTNNCYSTLKQIDT